MEKDTVLLSKESYDDLQDFKRNIEQNFSYEVQTDPFYRATIFTSEEMHEHTISLLEFKDEIIQRQKELIRELKHPEEHEMPIEEVKCLSWWELIKWKRGKLKRKV
ncbi:MAG: hypothetical protein ACXAC7_12310 [Candidatus Hodarchaeales archaeon]|jgi:hypothetical protein